MPHCPPQNQWLSSQPLHEHLPLQTVFDRYSGPDAILVHTCCGKIPSPRTHIWQGWRRCCDKIHKGTGGQAHENAMRASRTIPPRPDIVTYPDLY